MRFQAIGVALCAAALAAIGACATTAPSASGLSHAASANGVFGDLDFSNLELAANFSFRAAAPIVAANDADASYALPHEDALGAGKSIRAQHTDHGRRSNATRIAENLPPGWAIADGGMLLHKASGLKCPPSINLAEEKRAFELLEVRAFDQKNLDVGCNYSTGKGADLTVYASFWPNISIEDSAGGAIEAIGLRFQLKGSLPVAVANVAVEDANGKAVLLEKPEAAAFDIGEVNGVPYKTALWVVKTHGWHVKARATYPQQDVSAEIVSAVMFAFSHTNVFLKNEETPITEGGEV